MPPKITPPAARKTVATDAPMKNRVLRCDDPTWDQAMARAKADGLVLSDVMRHYLREYAAGRRK